MHMCEKGMEHVLMPLGRGFWLATEKKCRGEEENEAARHLPFMHSWLPDFCHSSTVGPAASVDFMSADVAVFVQFLNVAK